VSELDFAWRGGGGAARVYHMDVPAYTAAAGVDFGHAKGADGAYRRAHVGQHATWAVAIDGVTLTKYHAPP